MFNNSVKQGEMVKVGRCADAQQRVELAHGTCNRGDAFPVFQSSITDQVTGPSGGAARPRDVEMERTRLEEKGIGSHRDFREGFLRIIKPFL